MAWRHAVLVIVTVGCVASGRRVAPTRVSDLQAIATDTRSDLQLPGVSIVVMRGDVLLYARGHGLADIARDMPSDESTIYPIGSISKQVTAATVMKLVEQGDLALDAPVSRYLDELRATSAGSATLRQLLQQTSGIPAWDDLPEMQSFLAPEATQPPSDAELLSRIGRAPALYAPGTWWSYSNSNYTLLALVIERAARRPLDEAVHAAVIAPLQLEMGECTAERFARSQRRAVGYRDEQGVLVESPLTVAKLHGFRGAGGMCASAIAVARWTRALVRGRVVSQASLEQMTRTSKVAGFVPPYGFGVSLVPIDGERVIWHMGVMSGFVAVNAHWPEHDLTIVAITNIRRVWLQELVKRLARRVLDVPVPRILDLPIPVAERARIIGNYNDHMFPLRVFAADDRVFVETPLGPPFRLLYQGGHRFATTGPEALRLYFHPAGHLEWEWGELRAYARRIP